MGARLSVGAYAQTPYFLAELKQNIYCIEELCYCIRNNVFLVSEEVLEEPLANWLAEECLLAELSEDLLTLSKKYQKHRQKRESKEAGRELAAMAMSLIMEFASFYDRETVYSTIRLYREGSPRELYEQQARRLRQLLWEGHWLAAKTGLRALLDRLEELQSREGGEDLSGLKAALWHNQAVALIRLGRYSQAALCFEKAYSLDGNEDSLEAYLASRRRQMPQQEYLDWLGGQPQLQEPAARLEHRLAKAREDWQGSYKKKTLDHLRELRKEGRPGEAWEQERVMLRQIKEGCREALSR